MIDVREYVDLRGRSFYRDWLVKLDKTTIARVIGAVLRMESGNFFGSESRWHRSLGVAIGFWSRI